MPRKKSTTKKTQPRAEKRRFGMDPNLLMHVIKSQAGSLAKAALEAVMNSVDAGATRCDLELTGTRLTVDDDGKGFVDRSEIEGYFETFGTPHEEGDATYGHFRLGRGQLFSYGKNEWKSGKFEMSVDIKNAGLDYDLTTKSRKRAGCLVAVTLYDKLTPSEVDRTAREIKDFVRYAPIPVTLNSKRISADATTEEWDHETDDAWYRFQANASSMVVYNLGVLVERRGTYNYGTGGVVVSKRTLKVNMARNQVDSSCPIWQRIQAVIRKHGMDQTHKQTRRQTEAQRQLLATSLLTGELDDLDDYLQAKCLTDVKGRHLNVQTLARKPAPLAVAPRGDHVCERATDSKMAFVLSTETLERFGVDTLEALIEGIAEVLEKRHIYTAGRSLRAKFLCKGGITTPKKLGTLISDHYEPVPDKDLTEIEKLALSALRKVNPVLRRGIVASGRMDPGDERRICVGASATRHAWTDGSKTIWIERSRLKLLNRGFAGAAWLMRLLVHEYLHSEADAGSHAHDPEFYGAFHDLLLHDDDLFVDKAAERVLRSYARSLEGGGKKRQKAVLESLDHDAVLTHIAEKAAAEQEKMAAASS